MQFYTKNHKHYCGIGLPTKMMYVCILNSLGEIVLHEYTLVPLEGNPTNPTKFLKLISPFQDDLVIGVECMFSWYWLADECERQKNGYHKLALRSS